MSTFPHFHQLGIVDCGPICLRMLVRHYGRSYTVQSLREKLQVGRKGVPLLGISEAVVAIEFRTMGQNFICETEHETLLIKDGFSQIEVNQWFHLTGLSIMKKMLM